MEKLHVVPSLLYEGVATAGLELHMPIVNAPLGSVGGRFVRKLNIGVQSVLCCLFFFVFFFK